MGCEQVCLKWNNFSCNITKNIDDLWKDESLVDVSLISDGQCIQAHKVILSASSPLFKSLFAVNPCQHPVIILQDVRFRELVSIITFIYKGEVNILEDNLPALLQAAKTLQIRGLSDSVDRDSLNRLYALREEESERAPKKRKTKPPAEEESISENIIPKEEPKQEPFSADFLVTVSDDEDVNAEDIVLHQRNQDSILQTNLAHAEEESKHHEPFPAEFLAHVSDEEDVKTEISEDIVMHDRQQLCLQAEPPTDGNHIVGKKMYQHMPYANLLPSAEVLLRWAQSRSLDQLAIDLMKRLFTTEERLICNVNGKMGKPRFHTGKITLLREVLYYYSGVSPVDFELHWKNCVTKIDTSNRGLKRNKKLRTQMFFMDSYLAKTFT